MNQQAKLAGEQADKIIDQLANPGGTIEGTETEVIDQVKQVPHSSESHENWEKRFKGYKASTDKTLYELRQKAKQFDLISEENSKLKDNLQKIRQQVPSTPKEALDLFSKEEWESVGNFVDSKMGGLQEEVSYLKAELAREKQRLKQDEIMQKHNSVVDAVRQAVPHYEQIDVHPQFKKYIQELDEYGNKRLDLLLKAKNSTPPDITRIVQFYREFEAQMNVQQETKQQQQKKQFTQQELLQVPKAKPTVAGKPTKERLGIVWDEPTIQAFYRDKALSKISPEEAVALEQDMIAYQYGR